ncbi:MAG: hypothetical protein JEZ12_27165 [Desulfobacterium sp.]|nr:hypothetical protein [Desulfobacterium sp.]
MKNNIVHGTRADDDGMQYRGLSLRLSSEGIPVSLDTEKRTVECIMATEASVRMFDYARYEYIPEILLASGVEIPESRQVPLLDTHSRYSTSSVIGSTRDIRVEGDQLVGCDHFSNAPEAEGPWTKTAEGHLTDRSIGYSYDNKDAVYVDDGETAIIEGREFVGPVKVVKRWKVKENSICPIGADEKAKARASQPNKPIEKEKKMDPKLRAYLEANGLSATATDEEANAFFRTFKMPERTAPVDLDKERAEAARIERERCSEIRTMAGKFDQEDLGKTLVDDGKTIEDARKAIMDAHIEAKSKEETPGHRSPMELGLEAAEKFRAAGTDALLSRAGRTPEKPATGHDELMGYSLRELARKSLQVAGQKDGGNAMEMVGRALTTSDFPILLANTANKALAAGWASADESWREWCGTGSVSDFKANTMNRASETDDLDEITEENEYKYGNMTEAKETYQIATYGKMFAIGRHTIINDDLNALTGIPAKHGEAASRKLGDIAYAVLTANSAMGDSKALFHADHSNYVASGSGAAPGVSTMAAAVLAMKSQKDIKGKRRLNIRPVFLLGPNSIEGATETFFKTDKFDDTAKDATRVNIYAGSSVSRIYEGRLDDNLTTGWYLAGPKGKTVNMFFLNGVQAPYMETKQGWNVDGVEYKVRIDAGAKAVDWKALFYNYGE